MRWCLVGALISALCSAPGLAQAFRIVLFVTEAAEKPVPGLQFAPTGRGSLSDLTTRLGQARMDIPPGKAPGDSLDLMIVEAGQASSSWNFLSPSEGRAIIPREGVTLYVRVQRKGSGRIEDALFAMALKLLNPSDQPDCRPVIEDGSQWRCARDKTGQELLVETAEAFGFTSGELLDAFQRRAGDEGWVAAAWQAYLGNRQEAFTLMKKHIETEYRGIGKSPG